MDQERLIGLLTLKKIPNLGDSSIKKMIRAVGSVSGIFNEQPSHLLQIKGIGNVKIKEIHQSKYRIAAEKELKFIEKENIQYTIYDQDTYPNRLKHCLDGPVVLFSRGRINLNQKKTLSIVGTRKATHYGTRFCEELIEQLAPVDPVIISGFAYGIDIAAHQASIKHNLQTIGCLAHGFHLIYPKAHKKYVSQMESNGGFFTDFWSSDAFDRKNFLSRNRIIAGLSEATIVIESADKGGSLVTAEIASSYHRDVFAVPGRIHDPLSKGCNMLIKTQKAHMITSAADLLYMLNWQLEEHPKPAFQKKLFVELTPDEEKIHSYLENNGKTILDSIALQCKLPIFKVSSILLTMELKGLIKPLPGKLFEAI